MRVILSAGKKVYFTLLASSFMFPISAFAQCVDNEDCVSLGYTETNNKENCLKCPFGEYWACSESSGEKPIKPDGPQTAVLGQCNGYAKNCRIGDILNSDGTCTSDKASGKTPIAVVVYVSENNCGQALALDILGRFSWSTVTDDIPDLQNYKTRPTDTDSCENTKIVIDYSSKKYGDSASNYYPAFWEVYNYAPSDAQETKGKWCLPSSGVLFNFHQDTSAINTTLTKLNKEPLQAGFFWWASDEYDYHWAFQYPRNSGEFYTHKSINWYVRPVIAF